MPAIRAASGRIAAAKAGRIAAAKAVAGVALSAGPLSRAALIAPSISALKPGEPAFEFVDPAGEAVDLSIARVRCSSNGRGPRRSIGPGAWPVMGPSIRTDGRARHRVRRSGPEPEQGPPRLVCLPVQGQGGELALPQRDPVPRQPLLLGRVLAHASSILLVRRTIRGPWCRRNGESAAFPQIRLSQVRHKPHSR